MTIWAMMIVEIVHPHVKEMYLTEEVFADCADCLQATESLGLSLKTPGAKTWALNLTTVNPRKLETGLGRISAGIPSTLLLRIEAIGFPTFGRLL